MIIAGWILALFGLAQVVYAGTLDVSQLVEGNRLLGIAPSVVADADLVAQRAMIHQSGCATFLAGAIFLAAAYLKPAPPGAQSKAWVSMGAIAAGSLAFAAAAGFGFFLWGLHDRNADQRLVQEIRERNARAESTKQLEAEVDRRLRNEAEAAEAAGGAPP
ncbi:MAG: hypothetical protein ACK4YQ_17160 [Phenylobacterium sp.]|uniref:hypothetical protein n=1 Tax=Phenylobacterium sp. TaxID=1871053 RepID=UPI00391924B0